MEGDALHEAEVTARLSVLIWSIGINEVLTVAILGLL